VGGIERDRHEKTLSKGLGSGAVWLVGQSSAAVSEEVGSVMD
jgi:hypothetical protein